jgi:acyl-CoA dehydrogenase
VGGRTLGDIDHSNVDATCKALVKALGDAGWLQVSAVDPTDDTSRIDVRSLCILRETLARHDGLADFAFAMQGLGTGAFRCSGRRSRKRNGCRKPAPARPCRPSR